MHILSDDFSISFHNCLDCKDIAMLSLSYYETLSCYLTDYRISDDIDIYFHCEHSHALLGNIY